MSSVREKKADYRNYTEYLVTSQYFGSDSGNISIGILVFKIMDLINELN